jgi:hypothetical protein
MDAETRKLVEQFVHDNIDSFHEKRLKKIKALRLDKVLARKNPYLFRAKNLNRPADLVAAILDASLSSSEEGSFGGFLEDLAIFVAENTGGGVKSGITGLDIELSRENVRYLITVKSGQNWGNSDQRKKMKDNFTTALRVLRQSPRIGQLQPVEGICYGKFGERQADRGRQEKGDYIRLIGQKFWQLISGDEDLYADLIEPLGHEAEAHATKFESEKDATYTRLTAEFIESYCDSEYKIDWPKLVKFVSQTNNLPAKVKAKPKAKLKIKTSTKK